MKKSIVYLMVLLLSVGSLQAQDLFDLLEEEKKENDLNLSAKIGLDLAQLALIHPKVGAGESKMAFGGLLGLGCDYKSGKLEWNSAADWQMGMQRLGNSDNPFKKNMDILKVSTKLSYPMVEKFNYLMLGLLETSVLQTYSDYTLKSSEDNSLFSQFFAPAVLTLSPGVEYQHSKRISAYISPVSYKGIYVMNDELAQLGVHGNPFTSVDDYENVKHELGMNLGAKYELEFLKSFKFHSGLSLYYDYLADDHGFDYVDVIWINNLDLKIFNSVFLSFMLDTRWDRNIASVLTDDEINDGDDPFKKWMITESIVVKFAPKF